MAKKELGRAQSEDFTILEDGKKIGEIRIKASGVLWKPKRGKDWFRVSIEKFAKFAEENGTKQKM